MKTKDLAAIRSAIDSGHITWQCPELDADCKDCAPAEDAWNTLMRAIATPKKRKKAKAP